MQAPAVIDGGLPGLLSTNYGILRAKNGQDPGHTSQAWPEILREQTMLRLPLKSCQCDRCLVKVDGLLYALEINVWHGMDKHCASLGHKLFTNSPSR